MSTKHGQQEQNYQKVCTSIINFIPLDKIGEGSFSSVYKVRRITDDQIYALKKIKITSLKQKQKQNALNQIRILASINSQYIVQYRQAFFDQKLNLLCIVMEYASNCVDISDEGDLQKKIETYRKSMTHIPENVVWKAAYQTIKGLQILHSKSILHRDIKSANIFINNGVYKLGDLNVSKIQDNTDRMAYTQTGTPYYASPQVWRDQAYDSKSDIWSLGCVLYQMCTYRPPFKGKDLETLYKNVQRGLYDPLPIQYSQQLAQFISSCLRMNPKQRLSCKQLLSSSVLLKKCHELNLQQDHNQLNEQLLQTIKMPSDLKELRKKLPKSKYSCSIDSFDYKKNKIQLKQKQQKYDNNKDILNDYYIKLANRKRQNQGIANSFKLNRVTSEASAIKNPQDYVFEHKKAQGKKDRQQIISADRQIKISEQLNKPNDFKKKQTTPRSQYNIKGILKIDLNNRHKKSIQQIKQHEQKGNDEQTQNINKRKLSCDQQIRKSSRVALNHLSLIKKLSQPDSVNKCLSQRHITYEIQNSKNIQTQRHIRDEKLKKIIQDRSNQQIKQIQKKIDEKRKQLRKIGSIQRLQGANSKNMQNLSYRPTPPLVLYPHSKKSEVHVSNILHKSPTSTQDQISGSNAKQRISSHKRLIFNPQIHKVSSTPYMMGGSQAPRMKKILQSLTEAKKAREGQQKSKILSNRCLYKY